jgi:hypothetical protein
MRRGSLLIVVAMFGVGIVHGSSDAGVRQQRIARPLDVRRSNAETARHYLALVGTALVAMTTKERSDGSAIDRVVTVVRNRCPAIAAGAPGGPSRWSVEVGITEALGMAAAHVNLGIALNLLRGSERLHWNDPPVARVVQRSVRAASRQAELAIPDLCGVLREWATGGFQVVPRELTAFSQKVEALSEAGGLVPTAIDKDIDRRDALTLRNVRQHARSLVSQLRRRILGGRAQILRAIAIPRPKSARARARVRASAG